MILIIFFIKLKYHVKKLINYRYIFMCDSVDCMKYIDNLGTSRSAQNQYGYIYK